MGLFTSNGNSYLGVDIGTSSIKVCEIGNFKGRPKLLTYGFTEKSTSLMGPGGMVEDVEEAAHAIKSICQKAGTHSKKAVTALPNFAVFTSILSLPAMSKKELASAINWEAKKIIPTPLEEMILDWKIVEEEEVLPAVCDPNKANPQENRTLKTIFSKPKKNLKVLLTGANKSLVKKYIDIFNKAELSLLSLETENFALIRSLVGNDKSSVLVMDLGANTSSITIVDKGIPIICRSLELGGLTITKAISMSLNVNLERAEQFKQDMSLDSETAENSLPQTVEKAFGPILHEIEFMLNLYQEQHGKRAEKVILSGGSALLGHLPGYLADRLKMNVYIGDPWARTVYPMDLKPILDRLGSKFAVSIGLAMREIE